MTGWIMFFYGFITGLAAPLVYAAILYWLEERKNKP